MNGDRSGSESRMPTLTTPRNGSAQVTSVLSPLVAVWAPEPRRDIASTNDLLVGHARCSADGKGAGPADTAPDVVGVTGFEPAASSSRTKRATKLRHTPVVRKRV